MNTYERLREKARDKMSHAIHPGNAKYFDTHARSTTAHTIARETIDQYLTHGSVGDLMGDSWELLRTQRIRTSVTGSESVQKVFMTFLVFHLAAELSSEWSLLVAQ